MAFELFEERSSSPVASLYVIDRHGRRVPIDFSCIQTRIQQLSDGLAKDGTRIGHPLKSSPLPIIQSVISGVRSDMRTREIDEMSASIANTMSSRDSNYDILASRIIISNHHENTPRSFCDLMEDLYNNTDDEYNHAPLISNELYQVTRSHGSALDQIICDNRDYERLSYFGFVTLARSYLLKTNHQAYSYRISQERPQHMYLRVALGIHLNQYETIEESIQAAKNTYDIMSQGYMIHATPTLFNSGTSHPQLSSCFLMGTYDSLEGIFKNLTDAAMISKWAGGIGIHITNIRGENSLIRKTGGRSNGIMPMLKMYDEMTRYVNQGGKRNGSAAIYLEPWHPDIEKWLEAKRPAGVEQQRARNLFYGLYVNSLFMQRVEQALKETDPIRQSEVKWSLFDPDCHPALTDLYGEEFNQYYLEAEQKQSYQKQVSVISLWRRVLTSQIETGIPYILYKDHINHMSNQQNIGTIKSSNLCCEIVEYSDHQEYAVCNLASLALPRYLRQEDQQLKFDFELLGEVVEHTMRNLNNIIDKNYYPTIETRRSNLRHRPVGLGVQGLADVFMAMHLPFDSPEARQLNIDIFQTIYYHALRASCDISQERETDMAHLYLAFGEGRLIRDEENEFEVKLNHEYDNIDSSSATYALDDEDLQELLNRYKPIPEELTENPDRRPGAYASFSGSPLSQGKFQFDLRRQAGFEVPKLNSNLDWEQLRTDIQRYGVRNSLCVAPMPTATTSNILNNTESFEPIKENVYTRKTLGGQFFLVNKFLCEDLKRLNLWTPEIIEQIKDRRGSVQGISEIPEELQKIYRTAFEIKTSSLIYMSADRQAFIDQSQSLNLFVANPTEEVMTAIHLLSHRMGLKTGQYYLRRKPIVDPIQNTSTIKSEHKLAEAASSDKMSLDSPSKLSLAPPSKSSLAPQIRLEVPSMKVERVQIVPTTSECTPDCESCNA